METQHPGTHASAPAPDAVPAIEAVVQAGATETHYRRAGCGSTVLLLFPGGAADPLAALLFDRLARRFRVIAPLPPAGVVAGSAEGEQTAVSTWLRDLIDGLGLVRPGVVAGETLAAAVLAFSRTDPDRAGAIVTVSGDHADAAHCESGHRRVVLRLDGVPEGSAEAMKEMARCLETEAAPA